MDLDQLRAFAETARRGSFSAAAAALGLAQPSVSRQLRQLEAELGFPLIDREQRPVAPTAAGRELLATVERVLAELDAATRKLTAGDPSLSGPIRVAASSIPGEFLVPGLLARFTARHPAVRPNLVVTDSAGVAGELLAGRAEVGFLGAPMGHSRLRLVPFAEDEIVLAVPAEHPLARKGRVALSELAGKPLVEREGGSGTLESLRRLLAGKGLRLPEHRVAMVAGTTRAQLAAIEAGVGLGFVSSLALGDASGRRVAQIAIEDVTVRRTLYIAHPKQGPLSAVAQALVRFALGER